MALVKYNNQSIADITETGLTAGAMVLIKEQTASSDSTINFINGTSGVVLDSTYPIYLFKFINIHAGTDSAQLTMNFSVDTGSNYNVTKTTTAYKATHSEDDGTQEWTYHASYDLAQSTAVQKISNSVDGSSNADSNAGGHLYLFGPSSTTFVKHFLCCIWSEDGEIGYNQVTAGYGNTTSAVDAVQFALTSGDIDAGTFKLYGIKDS